MSVVVRGAAALLVVDLQSGTLRSPFLHPVETVLATTARLVGVFRETGRPVVWAVSAGTPPGRNAYGSEPRVFDRDARVIDPTLDARTDDPRSEGVGLSAFARGPLEAALRERDVQTLVLAGVATSFGVESTARHGYDLGFDVVVASDAVTDLQEASHHHSLRAVLPAIAQVADVDQIAAVLLGDR